MAMSQTLDQQVAASDEDRWLASRFADRAGRRRLVALYAFADEIARAAWVTSEPMIAEIRLAWWREAVAEMYGGHRVREHPIAQAMVEAFAEAGGPSPTQAQLETLIDARLAEMDDQTYADEGALAAHIDGTAGALAQIAMSCLAPDVSAHASRAAKLVGRVWGLTGLARSFSAMAARGRAPVAHSTLEVLELRSRNELAARRDPAKFQAARTPLIEGAQAAYDEARRAVRGLNPALWPAVGYAALAPGYLRLLRNQTPQDMGPAEMMRLRRQAVLLLSAVRGVI